MDSSTSTITVFVVTADIRSERRIDFHTTVGQLKVRSDRPDILSTLHFASLFNLWIWVLIYLRIGKTGNCNWHSCSEPSDLALSQRGRSTADTIVR